MKKFITNKYVLTILGIILFLLIWLLISSLVQEKTMVFPDPIATFKETGRLLGSSYLYKCLGSTLLRMLIGFLIAFILAMLFGLLAGSLPVIEHILKPTIVALKSIPTAAVVFLFLILLGARYAPVIIVILISFPILYDSVLGGIRNIPKEINEVTRVDGNSFLQSTFKVKMPLSIPYVIVGMASSFALSFKIEIMAEILTGDTRSGLGSAILAAQKQDPSNMVPIFAYSLVAIVLVLVITLLEDILTKTIKSHFYY